MTEFEVFRITPEVGNLCYEYAESTRSEGRRWQSERHFTNSVPLYVGRLIRFETGGYGDHKWRTDYFEDNTGVAHVVNYSYAGTTCFRVVPCLPAVIPSFKRLAVKVVKEHYDTTGLADEDPINFMINHANANGRTRRKHKRQIKHKKQRKSRKSRRR